MKKFVIGLTLALSLTNVCRSQNVGIADPAPSARLTVRGTENTLDGQQAAIKLNNTLSTNAWYFRAGATGTNTPANGFSIADNSGYHFNMSAGGNLGLGISPATSRLHVNGMLKLEGLNLFEFGAGVPGKEVSAGKIGYNAFGHNALTFVGAGTSSANRAVYFYAEGGATFNGPVAITGKVTRPSTGSANLVPVAFGSVDGTVNPPVILNGSGNFSVIRSAPGFYSITVTGETIDNGTHTTVVSLISNSLSGGPTIFSTPSLSVPFGRLLVLTGNSTDQKFSFITYKP